MAQEEKQGSQSSQPTGGTVQVTCGSLSYPVPVAGKTVAEARDQLKKVMDITADRKALVNDVLVTDESEFIIPEGATVEFVKTAGQKGLR